MVAVYRVGLKTKPHLKNSVLRIFFHNGSNGLAGVSFSMCLGWSANSPRRFARGGLDKVTPALQVVIVSHLLGEHKRDGNRMNSSKRFTVRYIGLCPC